jgi:hypothetical protein
VLGRPDETGYQYTDVGGAVQWGDWDLNSGPTDYESLAITVEVRRPPSLFKLDAGLPHIQFATIRKFAMAGLKSRV